MMAWIRRANMNLFQKIIEIRKSINKFTKDTKGFNYSYVSGSQVLDSIKAKMDELGVILEPSTNHNEGQYEIFQYTTIDKNGNDKNNIDYIVNSPMKYTWINADNPEEREEINWSLYGQQDEISKAFGSGLTYSERYFLLKFFGVPTDDEDPDSRQGDKGYKGGYDKAKTTKQGISEAQIKRLFAIAKKVGYTMEQVKSAAIKKFNKTDLASLTKEEYDTMCNGYEGVGKK
jgi:hypothetical protein